MTLNAQKFGQVMGIGRGVRGLPATGKSGSPGNDPTSWSSLEVGYARRYKQVGG
jgi:hypothetical protein